MPLHDEVKLLVTRRLKQLKIDLLYDTDVLKGKTGQLKEVKDQIKRTQDLIDILEHELGD